jgi:uncharacterized protein (DUF1330 family)
MKRSERPGNRGAHSTYGGNRLACDRTYLTESDCSADHAAVNVGRMKPILVLSIAMLWGAMQAPRPAYLISNAETITDTIMVKQYGVSVGKTVHDYGGTFLVGATPAIELDSQPAPKGRFVIIRFPSMEALQEWYNSPAYTAIRPLREKATTGHFYALQGVATP